MRITASQLRKIIKEEVSKVLNEAEEQLDLFPSKHVDYQAYMEAVALGDYGSIKLMDPRVVAQDIANWDDAKATRVAGNSPMGVDFGISPEELASVTKKVLMKLVKK